MSAARGRQADDHRSDGLANDQRATAVGANPCSRSRATSLVGAVPKNRARISCCAAKSSNVVSLITTITRRIVPVKTNVDSYRSETGETVSQHDVEGLVDGEVARDRLLDTTLAS